jgi:kynurenine formamidase
MFMRCSVISVKPDGREIRASHIETATAAIPAEQLDALVVRTLPNDTSKRTRHWENETSPYFTPDAMSAIRSRGVKHLLVDLPSIDPLHDGGVLAAHRVFWDMPASSTALPGDAARQRTITELIFVPDEVTDGPYLLTIQFPHIVSDAAPSRPILLSPDADDDT